MQSTHMKQPPKYISEMQAKEFAGIADLIAGYTHGSLTNEEHDQLDEWVGANDTNMYIFETLTDDKKMLKALDQFNEVETETASMRKRIKRKLHFTRYHSSRFFKGFGAWESFYTMNIPSVISSQLCELLS